MTMSDANIDALIANLRTSDNPIDHVAADVLAHQRGEIAEKDAEIRSMKAAATPVDHAGGRDDGQLA